MKPSTSKLLSLLLALVMLAGLMAVPALAEGEKTYSGDAFGFFKEDGTSAFGMLAPQPGSYAYLVEDDVVLHVVPKNTAVYNGLHWGSTKDAPLTKDLAFNVDGTIDITRPKTECGSMLPIAPIKASDGGTSKDQYYLAIPAADKFPLVLPYAGEQFGFFQMDGVSAFGMLAPQEGSTIGLKGDNVIIHVVPKNIDDNPLTKDVTFGADGSFDITLSKDKCGSMLPIAPIKAKDGKTSSAQYYLAVPAADKLEPIVDSYAGDSVTFIKEDGSAFGMFAPQTGTTAVLDGDSVVIHYVPKTTTVYTALHWGPITDTELTKDVTLGADYCFDITLSKDKCGTLIPVAPIKASDGGTSKDQYYLAVPAADKLPKKPSGGGESTQPTTDSVTLKLENKVPQFLVTSATLNTVGTAGSAGYQAELVLAMSNATYDKAYVGGKEAAASASATAALTGGAFTFPVTDVGTAPFAVSFHSKDSDNWYEHQFTLSDTTLLIEDAGGSGSGKGDSSELPYSGSDVTFVKKDGESSFGMFAPQAGTTAALSGDNVVIHYVPKNTTIYGWLHWGAIDDAELTKDVTFNTDGSFDITLSKDKCGKLLPAAPIKIKDGGTTSDQYYLAIPSADKLQGADSGSGSSSGSKDASAVDKKTVTNPDGSTTETVRYDDGSEVATTTNKDGSTDKVTTKADGSVGEVKTDASGAVTEASATLSASALAAAAGKPVTLPVLLPAAKDSASAAPLSVALPAGTTSAAVEIPVTGAGDDSVVVLVHADGTEEILPRTGKTANGLTVRLDGNATVKVVNNAQSFTDLPKNAEEAQAVRFVAARGIMNGVGDGAFAPDAAMTRGMIAAVLYRMERKPAAAGGAVFADVSAGQWYSDAIAWASANGIVQGYGESFGVNDAVTNEQLIVMLWRLAGKPKAAAAETGASDWAREAMSWAVSAGLADRSVAAGAPATRAQVAVMEMRFINLG